MTRQRAAIILAVCAACLFVAVNGAAPVALARWRIDVSAEQRASLSPAVRDGLRALDEPITLRVQWNPPAMRKDRAYRDQVASALAMLSGLARAAAGRVSIERDQIDNADRPILTVDIVDAVDRTAHLDLLAPAARTDPMTAVLSAVVAMQRRGPIRLAVLTSLSNQPNALTALGRGFARTLLAPNFTSIPADTDIVVVAHPWPMAPAQIDALEAFLARGGRGFLAVDPAFLEARPSIFAPDSVPTESLTALSPLLQRLGVLISADVVLDDDGALPVQVLRQDLQSDILPQPLMFRAKATGFERGVTVAGAGAVEAAPSDAALLLRSGSATARLPAVVALGAPSPWITSAIPKTQHETPIGLRFTRNTADIAVVADADFLLERWYRSPGATTDAADTVAFLETVLSDLAKPDWLKQARSSAPSSRPVQAPPWWQVLLALMVAPGLVGAISAARAWRQ